MTQTEMLLIAHLVFIAFYLGGQLHYLFILHSVSYQFFGPNEQIRFLQNVLKRQNPVLLLALCLAVLTGGFMITPLKGGFGQNYFSVFGSHLITKLGWFFILFFVTAYQTLSVGFKIRFLDPASGETKLDEKLAAVRTQMLVTASLNVLLTIIVIYYGMHLRG